MDTLKEKINFSICSLNIIDIFDRNIVDYHIGFHCEAKDVTAFLIRRNLFEEGATIPVI